MRRVYILQSWTIHFTVSAAADDDDDVQWFNVHLKAD